MENDKLYQWIFLKFAMHSCIFMRNYIYLYISKKIQKAQIIKFKWNLFAIIYAKNSSIYIVNNFEDKIR